MVWVPYKLFLTILIFKVTSFAQITDSSKTCFCSINNPPTHTHTHGPYCLCHLLLRANSWQFLANQVSGSVLEYCLDSSARVTWSTPQKSGTDKDISMVLLVSRNASNDAWRVMWNWELSQGQELVLPPYYLCHIIL